jgi:hypothetical protein
MRNKITTKSLNETQNVLLRTYQSSERYLINNLRRFLLLSF